MNNTFDPELLAALLPLIRTPRLLAASDFDGTISELVAHPSQSVVDPNAAVALRLLSELPNTDVLVVSGRSLHDLRNRLSGLSRLRLVGSHGGEFDMGLAHLLSSEEEGALKAATQCMTITCKALPESFIEEKPHSVAFHYRSVSISRLESDAHLLQELRKKLEQLRPSYIRDGKSVIEFSVKETNKGLALQKMSQHLHPTQIFFIGDDLTDEDAFRALPEGSISVKVGPEQTCAKFRVNTTAQAVELLSFIAQERQNWFSLHPQAEIHHHRFISDLRVGALLDPQGSFTWLCFPRMDSAPVFGSLVGGPASGYFSIRPATGAPIESRYIPLTAIAETRYETLSVCDFLECSDARSQQRAGRSDLYRVVEGTGEVIAEFLPRFDFGRIPSRITQTEFGLRVDGGSHPITLHSPGWQWEIREDGMHHSALGKTVLQDDSSVLRVCFGTVTPGIGRPGNGNPGAGSSAKTGIPFATNRFWSSWSESLNVPELYPEEVARSAIVLRALTYGPTGAIFAAPTTSLPEALGSMRNWDYRYCWPRDASFAAAALARLGHIDSGVRLLDWLLGVLDSVGDDEFLSPLYTVLGHSLLGEAEIPEAIGYRGSTPVRIGNLAAHQLQLDTLAPIVELLYVLQQRDALLSLDHVRLLERIVHQIELRWKDPDNGIWEIRGPQRHYVHSKLMCWYAVSRAKAVVEALGFERPAWAELSEQIRISVETEGFSEELNSYTCAYDLAEPDAALLWIILSGFHPPDHPRSIGLINFITSRLLENGTVYRYRIDDGLPGVEGSFHICTAWLIQALTLQRNLELAKRLLHGLRVASEPYGLLSEQWDPKRNGALGNFPQAYSHTGFIDSVLLLAGYEGPFR